MDWVSNVQRVSAAQGASPGWLYRASSEDVDEHASGQPDWQLHYDQLSPGRFSGSFTRIALPRVTIFEERTSQRVRQRGTLGKGTFAVGVPLDPADVLKVNGIDVTGDSAIVCSDVELDMCTPVDFRLAGLSGDAELILEALAQTEPTLTTGQLRQIAPVHLQSGAMARVRELLDFVRQSVEQAPSDLDDVAARQRLADAVLMELLEYMPATPLGSLERNAALRKRLVDRACELMLARKEEPPSMLEVCRHVGASQRKLNYCFQSVLGMTPVSYLRAVRLHGARRELRRAADSGQGVSEVAMRWGFWHFGQFAADYRRHFAETPSETLRRVRLSFARG